MSELFNGDDLELLEMQITSWLHNIKDRFDAIVAIDRGEVEEHRWYIRMRGEEKEFTTVWMTLGQRTLKYETYVMPAPEENAEMLYENLLRRNENLVGVHFSIGIEDAVFLRGEVPIRLIDEREIDRILGTLYAHVEQIFPTIIRIGFASRFAD